MTKKISEAIGSARNWLRGAEPQTPEGAIQYAQAWALIAIAEALLEERKQAEFAAEVEEMRQERRGREFTPPF